MSKVDYQNKVLPKKKNLKKKKRTLDWAANKGFHVTHWTLQSVRFFSSHLLIICTGSDLQ